MGLLAYWLLLAMPCVILASDDVHRCRKYVFSAKAEQKDDNGLRCWDHIKVSSCGGRCDSREISDWMFPFKQSHHPVCAYAAWRPVEARLKHCDDGVAPGTEMFRYISADMCHCKVCSSETTSCEWLPLHSNLLKSLIAQDSEN